MKDKIECFINAIVKDFYYNSDYEQVYRLKFYGDGVADFEKDAKATTKECLLNYITFCHEQIELAEKGLEEFE